MQLNDTFERLSSGLRIRRAVDDAAGLAIADSLRADTRLSNVAVRNINDAISLVAIREGALNEITNILTRMSELAIQSKNGTFTAQQRSPILAEFAALTSEISRITKTTKYNGISLLEDTPSIKIQAGITGNPDHLIPLFDSDSAAILSDIQSGGFIYSTPEVVKSALDNVRNQQEYGAARLDYALNNAQNMGQNFSSAESQIRDADYAVETANLVRQQIQQQAAMAILAQANIQPQFALQLLPSLFD